MRKLLGQLITLTVLLSACTGAGIELLKTAEPVQDTSAPVAALNPASTSLPAKPAATPTTAAASNPVSSNLPKKAGCSALELERSLLLTMWDRSVVGQALIPYDPELGAPLCSFKPLALGKNYYTSLSPDGSLLAYSMTKYEDLHEGWLHLIDLKAWTDIPTAIELDSWIGGMAFSPDNSRLAIAVGLPDGSSDWPMHHSLILVDVSKQVILSETDLEMGVRLLRFTPDGRSLMIYGVQNQDSSGLDGEAHAVLLDAANLEVQWDQLLDGVLDGQTRLYTSDNTDMDIWWGPAALISPERQALYIVHADADRLTSVDFAQRKAGTVEIHTQGSWFERFLARFAGVAHAKVPNGTNKQAVLSPDGTRLYVVGMTTKMQVEGDNEPQIEETFSGLQVIDTASGTEIAHIDTEASSLSISLDGKKVFLRGWKDNLDWTDVLDTATLEIEQHVSGRAIQQGKRLNQEPLFLSLTNQTGTQTTLAFFDPDTLKQKEVWWVRDSAWFVTP
jgi:hypothetical protein